MLSNLLHEKAKTCAKNFLQSEKELLSILIEMDKRRIFRELGYTGVFNYCLKALVFSESQASYFSCIVKKVREVPELKVAIDNNKLSVSKARRIIPVITQETHQQWIDKAATLTQKELEKEVAAKNPKVVRETLKPVSETRYELKLGIEQKLQADWKRVQDLVSKKKKANLSMEDVFGHVVSYFLDREDPVKKAERALGVNPCTEHTAQTPVTKTPDVRPAATAVQKAQTHTVPMQKTLNARANMVPVEKTLNGDPSSGAIPQSDATGQLANRKIPAHIAHQINLRDKGKCQVIGCENSRFVELHHIHPFSQGGEHSTLNVRTLCSQHHAMLHR